MYVTVANKPHVIPVWYIYLHYHKNHPNVGKYTIPMDPLRTRIQQIWWTIVHFLTYGASWAWAVCHFHSGTKKNTWWINRNQCSWRAVNGEPMESSWCLPDLWLFPRVTRSSVSCWGISGLYGRWITCSFKERFHLNNISCFQMLKCSHLNSLDLVKIILHKEYFASVFLQPSSSITYSTRCFYLNLCWADQSQWHWTVSLFRGNKSSMYAFLQ